MMPMPQQEIVLESWHEAQNGQPMNCVEHVDTDLSMMYPISYKQEYTNNDRVYEALDCIMGFGSIGRVYMCQTQAIDKVQFPDYSNACAWKMQLHVDVVDKPLDFNSMDIPLNCFDTEIALQKQASVVGLAPHIESHQTGIVMSTIWSDNKPAKHDVALMKLMNATLHHLEWNSTVYKNDKK